MWFIGKTPAIVVICLNTIFSHFNFCKYQLDILKCKHSFHQNMEIRFFLYSDFLPLVLGGKMKIK